VYELEACIEFSFAVFPQSAAFFEPCEGSFYHPSLWQDDEGMELVAFGDLHRGFQKFLDRGCKRLSRIPAIHQDALDLAQIAFAPAQGVQRPLAVRHIGRGDRNGMGKSLRIDRDMAFDPRHLLARVIALLAGGIGVLYALRVHNQKAGQDVAPLFPAGLAN
jgi:hypothetical protein